MQSKKSLVEDALARVLKMAYEKADQEDGQCLGCKGCQRKSLLDAVSEDEEVLRKYLFEVSKTNPLT